MKQNLLCWLLCLLSLGSWATPVLLRDPAQSYDLFRASSLLEVRPGQVSINALLQSPERYRFVPTENRLIRPYDRQNAYWFRVEVTNLTSDAFFLHFVYSGTERITVYEVADNQVIATHQLGRFEPLVNGVFRRSTLFCPIQAQQGGTVSQQTHTLYIYTEGLYTTCQYFFARGAANLIETVHYKDLFYGLYYGFILMIVVYSLMLFIRLREQDTLQYAVWVFFIGIQLALYRGYTGEFLWPANPSIERYATVLAGISGILHVLFTISFLRLRQQPSPLFYRIGFGVIIAYLLGIIANVVTVYAATQGGKQLDLVPQIALAEGVFSVVSGVVMYHRGFRPALFYIIGNLIFFVSIFVFLQYAAGQLPHSFWTYNSIHLGSGIEITLFTLALSYKVNLLKQGQEEAVREQLRLAETNKQLVEEQNAMLEAKVQQRTNELNVQKEGLQTALATLQETQQQLIQREKMASLGELMTGIAHEIQNPLNFINNFAELSEEMLGELKEEIEADHKADALNLIDELAPNLQKINHHGKRVDSIVRSMLQHSRSSTGARQLTDLNALAGEYLQLAYQGQRNKDKTFNVRLLTDFDAKIGLVDMIPEEIARVLLNLYNNAFYATHEKAKRLLNGQSAMYQPEVLVSTQLENNQVTLRVKDNGVGIPRELLNKIYQPFFTTKPTGQGVGLGLSLSYDIVTKSHNGQLDVRTEPGLFTEFMIKLPVQGESA